MGGILRWVRIGLVKLVGAVVGGTCIAGTGGAVDVPGLWVHGIPVFGSFFGVYRFNCFPEWPIKGSGSVNPL